MNQIKQYWLEYLQFTIGFSQITLSRDYKIFWIFIEIISQLQKVSIPLLLNVMITILQNKYFNKNYEKANDYTLLELMAQLCIPTTLIIDSVPNNFLIAVQVVSAIILFAPLVANIISLHQEQFEFSNIKYRSQIDSQQNLNHTLALLNNTYNMHNYIEHFLQKQLMGNDQASFEQFERFLEASFLNIFPHIFVIPLLYQNLMVYLILKHDQSLSITQYGLMIFFSVCTLLGTTINWSLSIPIQKSFTIRDSNHLKLVQSFWYKITQYLIMVPLVIQFIYCMYNLDQQFEQNTTYNYLVICCMLIIQVGNLIDFYYSHPFVTPYKQATVLILIPFTISIMVSLIFQHTQIEIISITLITVPLSSRLLKEIMQYLNDEILSRSQYKEKVKTVQKMQSRTGILLEEEQQFVIEKEIHDSRKVQIEYLQTQSTKFFIHYLRLIDLMNLEDQQSIEKGASTIHLKRSKFILNTIVLLKTHISQCSNIYCYCKGFRGERRTIIEKNYQTIDMKIYNTIKIENLVIQVELIKRYIRHYAKLIFEIEKEKSDIDILRITQLLTYLSSSEECYQVQLLVMEFKEKVKLKKNVNIYISMAILTSYLKHQILQKMNPSIKIDEVEATLQYKDYRVTETRRDKIITEIFLNIQVKEDFIKQIIDNKLNYEQLYIKVHNLVKYNMKTIRKIEQFNNFSFSRTSILLYMFYSLEVICDFDKFLRLRNQLKTKSFKFFEYSSSQVSQLYSKVSYLKINLARHAQKGKISRGGILQYSNNTPHIFGYGQREFKDEVLTIHQLISPNLSQIHDQIMEIFLITNRPQVIRKKRALLACKKNGDLLFVEMFIDLCFSITGDIFPIYCFLKIIKQDGQYENIKGHIYITNELKVEGISTMALEQFKLQDGKYLQKQKITKLVQNFQKYLDLLKDKEKKFQDAEYTKIEQGSCSNKFNYIESEQLLNHFSIVVDDIVFKIPKLNQVPDIYSAQCKFTMTFGNVNGKEYKSYTIVLQKITFAENASQAWIDSSKNLQSRTETSKNRDISQSDILMSDSDCGLSRISEKQSDSIIKINDYDFQVGLQIMSPNDTQHDIASLINTNNQILQNDNNINSVQFEKLQEYSKLKKDETNSRLINETRHKQQQSFFQKSISKKSFEIDNFDQSEHLSFEKGKNKDFRITQTPTTSANSNTASIIQKTHLFSKFSRLDYNPRLFYQIFLIGLMDITLFISLSSIFLSNFTSKLDSNTRIVDILRAFVTTDYTKNTLLAMGIEIDELQENDVNQTKLFSLIISNSENYLQHYQLYLDDSLVKSTLSEIQLNQFDYYSRTEETVSAWTEQFYVIYMLQGLASLNVSNDTTIEKFDNSLSSLISQYQVHKEAYEELTVKFQNQLNNNMNGLEYAQSVCLILFCIIETFFILTYFCFFRQLFRLQNRILRSCEQISFKALESESIRLTALLYHYQQASDLNLYKYQYQMKDKCQFNVNINEFVSNKRVSLKLQQLVQQTEQKKQFVISDEKSHLQNFLFLISLIAFIFGFSYFLTLKLVNSTKITSLQSNLDTFNSLIIFTEQFYQLMLSDQVSILYGNNQDQKNATIDQYKQLVNSSYDQVVAYQQELTSESEIYIDLLSYLTSDSCGLVSDSDCSSLIEGKISQGLLYATSYFVEKVRNNIENNYNETQLNNLTTSELIALDYVSTGFSSLIEAGQEMLATLLNEAINFNTEIYISFLVIIIVYQVMFSITLFIYFKVRFFTTRQIPYVLPPQSVYGEESFLKTLVYVEKIFDNFQQ